METDDSRPLLLLIDLQRDYLSAPQLEPAANAIVDRAAALLKKWRELHLPVAHVRTTVTRQPDNRMAHWKTAGRWQCEAGTPGHESPAELAPREGEPIISKSGFSGFTDGQLAELIRRGHTKTVILAGVHLHACVRQTALDAYQNRLDVWIAEDAVGSDDPLHAAITRRYLEARSFRFAPVSALIEQLSSPAKTPVTCEGATGQDGSFGFGTPPHPSPLPHSVAEREKSLLCDAQFQSRPTCDDLIPSALARATKAFSDGRQQSPDTRVRWIENLAAALLAKVTLLAELITREIGKPIRFSRIEVQRTAEMLRAIARRCREGADTADGSGRIVVRRRPHGVVAVITPWNNPVYIALGKIAPALLHGNSVAWKPAPEARNISRELMKLIQTAGWPDGCVELIEGDRRIAARLMSDPAIAAVTLTGSIAAGHGAHEICARRHVPLQAELGGNNAAIVWPDADLAVAARCIAAGAFEMAGQRCTANRRVVVHEKCRHAFLELLQKETAQLHWGDPALPETQIGPLVNAAHLDRVARAVKRAVAQTGPPLLPLGNQSPDANGHWFPPTILFAEDPAAEIVQEETFGPVLVVQSARNWQDAIDRCNGVRQGLAAAIFTDLREITERFLAEAEAGILKVNQSTSDAEVNVPFGGWKSSGIGPPEHGECDRDFFTRVQTVYHGRTVK